MLFGKGRGCRRLEPFDDLCLFPGGSRIFSAVGRLEHERGLPRGAALETLRQRGTTQRRHLASGKKRGAHPGSPEGIGGLFNVDSAREPLFGVPMQNRQKRFSRERRGGNEGRG